jgi:hypothetical protein
VFGLRRDAPGSPSETVPAALGNDGHFLRCYQRDTRDNYKCADSETRAGIDTVEEGGGLPASALAQREC